MCGEKWHKEEMACYSSFSNVLPGCFEALVFDVVDGGVVLWISNRSELKPSNQQQVGLNADKRSSCGPPV